MKKISAKTMRQLADIPTTVVILENGEVSTELEIKHYLPLKDIHAFVKEVVENSFDDNGQYDPIWREAAFAYAALKYYTNANTEASIESLWDFWCSHNIREKIYNVCSEEMGLDMLDCYITSKIEERKPKKEKGLDILCNKILSLFDGDMAEEDSVLNSLSSEDMLSLIDKIKDADWGAVTQKVLDQEKFKKDEEV